MRKSILNIINDGAVQLKIKVANQMNKIGTKLKEKDGNFFEEAMKYVIGFVLAALFLYIVYAILKNTIGPSLQKHAADLFNYSA